MQNKKFTFEIQLDFKVALFDFDGTIAHTGHIWELVDKAFLAKRNIPWTEEFAPTIAAMGFKEGARYVIDTYNLNETVEEICASWMQQAQEFYKNEVVLRPGALEYIKALKRAGISTALASANNRELLSALKPRIDVWGIFDEVVLVEDVGKSKNFPDVYHEALTRLGSLAQDSIVFEDIESGL